MATTRAAIVLLIFATEGAFFHPGGWNQYARVSATVAFVEPGTPYSGTFRIDGLKDGERLGTGDWAQSSEWMRHSADFHANPIGVFVDPAKIAELAAAGESFEEIHRQAMAGELSPSQPPVELPGQEQS